MLAIHSLINRCIEMDLDPSAADKENSEVRKKKKNVISLSAVML